MARYLTRLPGGSHKHHIPPIVVTRPRRPSSVQENGEASGSRKGKEAAKENIKAPWAPASPPEPYPEPKCPIEPVFLDVQPTDTEQNLAEKYGEVKEMIGSGSWGEIRLAHKYNEEVGSGSQAEPVQQQLFAVKRYRTKTYLAEALKSRVSNFGQYEYPPDALPEIVERKLLNEFEKRAALEYLISFGLQHANVVRTLDLMRDRQERLCMVMEYCGGGNLHDFVFRGENGRSFLVEEEADCFFMQIMRGFAYLHEKGLTHGHVKLQNMLLTEEGCVKLADFGRTTAKTRARREEIDRPLDNPEMLPPQLLDCPPNSYTYEIFDPRSSDIWSAGVMYVLMRTGGFLWTRAQRSDAQYAEYLNERMPTKMFIRKTENKTPCSHFNKLGKDNCARALHAIFHPCADKRITAKQFLDMPWAQEVRVCEAGGFGV